MNRYRRQIAFQPIGDEGQQRLQSSCVAICGMGALGSAVAERLCRAGVGRLILIDRDWVEWDNLPRQTLYTEDDAAQSIPKALAAETHLRRINSEPQIESHVSDLHWENIASLFRGASVIVDGTDNFETRFLINDFACQQSIPWVHAGIVGASGQSLTIVPGQTACFRCLIPEPPPAEQMQTCDSAGVIGPAVGFIANWQALEAMKLIVGGPNAIDGALRTFDLWSGDIRKLKIPRLGRTDLFEGCPACELHRFDFLDGQMSTQAKAMCGRNAVHIHSPRREPLDLDSIVTRLGHECDIRRNPYMIRFELDGLVWSVFHDGRAVLTGTEDIELARKLYARRIGA
jgi:molybdopterin-synthase adenylyltransferase